MHLVGDFDADYTFIDNDGPVFWFRTDKNAPRGKVVAIDIRKPAPADWVDLIPEQSETLQGVRRGRRLISGPVLLKDAHSVVRVFDLAGRHLRDVDFPGLGTAAGFEGKRTRQGDVLLIHIIHGAGLHLSV